VGLLAQVPVASARGPLGAWLQKGCAQVWNSDRIASKRPRLARDPAGDPRDAGKAGSAGPRLGVWRGLLAPRRSARRRPLFSQAGGVVGDACVYASRHASHMPMPSG